MKKKCLNCGKELTEKQVARTLQLNAKRYCSQTCHYAHAKFLAKNGEHVCAKCGIKIDKRLSNHWICRPCKRTSESDYYHNVNKKKHSEWGRIYYKNNAERLKKIAGDRGIRRHKELREMSLKAYGNKCACCSEKREEFLAIDHINGGGRKHRMALKKSIYLYLYQENFPKGFRVMCHNCNASMGYYGYCPHTKEHETDTKKTKEPDRGIRFEPTMIS